MVFSINLEAYHQSVVETNFHICSLSVMKYWYSLVHFNVHAKTDKETTNNQIDANKNYSLCGSHNRMKKPAYCNCSNYLVFFLNMAFN